MALIIDKAIPMLNELIEVAPTSANEALSKLGSKLRADMIRHSQGFGSANFGSKIENGTRRLISSKEGGSKQIFSRYSHKTGELDSPDSMAELIRSYLSEENHSLSVGFMGQKAFTPTKFRDGKIVGKMPRVKGTGKEIKKIGQIYEAGGTFELSDKQKRFFKASGWGKAAKRGTISKRSYPLVATAYASSHRQAKRLFKEYYLNALFANRRVS